jgi:DNA helicase II / ATP-dependent DNA helicase PcrA
VNYLDGLNDAQKEAVLATDGPVSVLAGAGSGKTRVLTTRIYHLIRSGVAPESILAVTFTNKAAREMRERLGAQLGQELTAWKRGSLPFVATFHGLGRELLEQYGRPLGIGRHFTIFDRDDSTRAIKEALKSMSIDPKEIEPRSVLNRISRAKNDGYAQGEFSERFAREHFRTRVVADVWRLYEETLKKEKALDFDDLLTLPVKLLTEHPGVRQAVQERFHYIHIDEFQDTNEVQGKLAALLAGSRKNLFVVGDIDQTIYTWRGATIDNLLEFEKQYANARTIVLSHNYRSTKTIVDAANQIIERNKNRKEKTSVTNNGEGEPVSLMIAETAEGEAAWIAREASHLVRNGTPVTEIAVLFRTNFQSRVLEEAFLSQGLPYRLLGTRFYDRKEVKDVLSWVRLALDPSREADRIRAVQFPSRGIGKVLLGKLTAGVKDELKPSERVKVEKFEAIISKLNTASETLTPSEFVRLVISDSGIEEALSDGTEEDAERLQNAKELATLASRHDEMPGRDGISAFLADAALAGDQDEMDRPHEAKKEGITLMTVHAAKGLEFDAVFVTGMEEGLFPHEGMGDEERDDEEERRLFYVAVTRAKKKLYLTLAHIRRIYGTDYINEPSSFIRDIDESLVQYAQPHSLQGRPDISY